MTQGYQALTRGAAVLDLSGRARIRATGEDRARLLHALTTNHIQQLLPGHGCYAFFLNAQGRVMADANIFVFAEHILIDTEPGLRQLLWDHVDHYIIADDVTLHDDTETTFCLGVEGPQSKKRLCELGAPAPANEFAHEAWGDFNVAHATFTGGAGYRIFGPVEQKTLLLQQLYLAEATLQDSEVVRIEHARPQYGKDITIARLAAETGLTHALHFQKGCYLGQEIVERVRSRGHVNRRLAQNRVQRRHRATPGIARFWWMGKKLGRSRVPLILHKRAKWWQSDTSV